MEPLFGTSSSLQGQVTNTHIIPIPLPNSMSSGSGSGSGSPPGLLAPPTVRSASNIKLETSETVTPTKRTQPLFGPPSKRQHTSTPAINHHCSNNSFHDDYSSNEMQAVQNRQEELNRKELELQRRQAELDKKHSDMDRKVKEAENKVALYEKVAWKLRDALVEHVRTQCREQRESEKMEMYSNYYHLGQIVHNTRGYDCWQDGKDITDLKQKLKNLQEEYEQMKARRREKRKGKVEDDEEEEIYKLNVNLFKKEEASIQQEMEALEIKKTLYIKDCKRLQSEDNSRFNNNLILDNRYLLTRLLGKGGFSEVYKAIDLLEVKEVAVKIHQLNSNWTSDRKANYLKHANRECDIYKSLNHPRIVKLFDKFDIDTESFAIILEYCSGIDLDMHLKKHKVIQEKDAKSIMCQILSGLRYLHEQNDPIIHYDIKPGNILLTKNMEVKIIDFGLSKIRPEESENIDLTSQGAGTYWYLPPECFDVTPRISEKVDTWSAGVVFYQLLFGKKPFGNEVSQQAFVARGLNTQKSVEFPQKPPVSQETKNIITKMLTPDADNRPRIEEVLQDTSVFATKKRRSNITTSPAQSSLGNNIFPIPPARAIVKTEMY